MVWSNVLEKLKNDAHIPIAVLVFIVTTVVHIVTKADLGANYVNSLYAMYGFLAAHGGVAMWGKVKGSDDSSAAPSGDAKS